MATTLPQQGSRDVLYVVDLSGYVFRAYHAIAPLSSPSGEPTHATYGTTSMLQRLISERDPALLAVAMDSKTPSFRKAIDPAYKANRPPPPEDLSIQMTRCRDIVEALGVTVWQDDDFEADDLIATGVTKARAEGMRVVIVSADKDLMQLVDESVVMWDTMRNKVYGPAEVEEKFGVPPLQMRDLLALTGDTSDNIKGVPSVGPKTAAKLLAQFHTLEGVLANVGEARGKKLQENLAAHRDDALLSQRLVTLRDDVEMAFDRAALAFRERTDEARLAELYTELGFTRLLEALQRGRTAQEVPSRATRYEAVLDRATLERVVGECRRAGRFAIDTETDSTNPMRAALMGLSLSFAPDEGYYVPIGHTYEGAPEQLALEEVRELVAAIVSDPTVGTVGHHLKYDETVLRRHGFPPIGGCLADTMIESYLLDPEAPHGLKDLAKRELGVEMTTFAQVTAERTSSDVSFGAVPLERAVPYASADADLTLQLHDKLYPRLVERGLRSLLEDVEVPLSQVLVDVEMRGVLVDVSHLAALGARMQEQMTSLEARAKQEAGREFNVNSPRQLETILFDELKLPVIKRTKTARSTDAEVLDALAEAHPLVSTILELRQLAKLKSTYVDTLPELVDPETGRIHTQFNQGVAATGRLSSSDPNLQNIPIRTEEGKMIREAFIAPPGYVILSADYSQIELRVLAHLAHDEVLIDSFRRGEDVHTRTAMEIFGVGADGVTSERRRQAKAINFGVIYGMGEVALAKRLGIERQEASEFIRTYFERYQGVRRFMDETLEAAREGQAVRTILGRYRHLPDLRSANRRLRAQAERIAGNTPIQGSAADLLKLAMVRLREPVVPGARMILTVHDELVFEIPEREIQDARRLVKQAMEGVMQLEVPLVVDVGTGKNWAEAH